MAKRQVFFSFEYKKDCQRAAKVRNMGKVDDSSTFSDNDVIDSPLISSSYSSSLDGIGGNPLTI